MPERIQLRRTKGWRKPDGAVVVARPTRWGNPWAVSKCARVECGPDLFRWCVTVDRGGRCLRQFPTRAEGVAFAVEQYRTWLSGTLHVLEVRALLAGRDLACWCPLTEPCHADVLLELANTTSTRKWTPTLPNGRGGRTIHVKRCCNGCRRPIGDVTDAEMIAAIDGRPLPDVRVECGCAS